MSGWTFALVLIATLVITIPSCIAGRLYMQSYHPQTLALLQRHTGPPWYYFANSLVFFLSLAVVNRHGLHHTLFFLAVAGLQVTAGVLAMIRDRTQFSIFHLLAATTGAAVLALLMRWFGWESARCTLAVSGIAIAPLTAWEAWKLRKRIRSGAEERPGGEA